MKDPVYKLIELTGTSTTSIEEAVDKAIKRAHKTVKNPCWFQVVETRGNIDKGKVHHWQVTIKVGFAVEDERSRGQLPRKESIGPGAHSRGVGRKPTRWSYFDLTCSVETTFFTPSVSSASSIAFAMASWEGTVPDNVTTPSVVST
jgi:dodecin